MDPQDPFDPAQFAMPAGWQQPPSLHPLLKTKSRQRRQRAVSADEYFSVACWRWLVAAARLPGKAFQIGVLLWHLRNLTSSKTVRWRPSKANEFGISRQATYRGLEALEAAGLATVERHRGRCHRVTILDLRAAEDKESVSGDGPK